MAESVALEQIRRNLNRLSLVLLYKRASELYIDTRTALLTEKFPSQETHDEKVAEIKEAYARVIEESPKSKGQADEIFGLVALTEELRNSVSGISTLDDKFVALQNAYPIQIIKS